VFAHFNFPEERGNRSLYCDWNYNQLQLALILIYACENVLTAIKLFM